MEEILRETQSIQIYHITSLENLESIIANSGIFCKNAMTRQNIDCTNIAHRHIQDRRAKIKVPNGPEGTLHDYVPFYFAPRSPMLYAIYKDTVSGYLEGQESIVYLVSNIQTITAGNRQFVFTDGHAVIEFTRFFENLKDLDQIDWSIMTSRMWNDTLNDNDRKRRRQAEFLIYDFFPWKYVLEIGVMNSQKQNEVQAILPTNDSTLITVHNNWYY